MAFKHRVKLIDVINALNKLNRDGKGNYEVMISTDERTEYLYDSKVFQLEDFLDYDDTNKTITLIGD